MHGTDIKLNCTTYIYEQHKDLEVTTFKSLQSSYQSKAYNNITLNEFKIYFFFYLAQQPPMGQGFLIHKDSRSHTTHHSRYDSSRRAISSSQRPLPDNT
jgi:hypothetical protein